MNKETIGEQIQSLGNDTREYARLHIELLKLHLTDGTARVFSVITTLIILIGFGFFVLFFIAMILWFVFVDITGSVIWASTIIALLYSILGWLTYVFRRRIILDPMVNVLTRIIHSKEGSDEE